MDQPADAELSVAWPLQGSLPASRLGVLMWCVALRHQGRDVSTLVSSGMLLMRCRCRSAIVEMRCRARWDCRDGTVEMACEMRSLMWDGCPGVNEIPVREGLMDGGCSWYWNHDHLRDRGRDRECCGRLRMRGWVRVCGRVQEHGRMRVFGQVRVLGQVRVRGCVRMHGRAWSWWLGMVGRSDKDPGENPDGDSDENQPRLLRIQTETGWGCWGSGQRTRWGC